MNDAAWATPAEREEVAAAVSFLATAVQPDIDDEVQALNTRLLSSRDYTRAELLLVMRELPFDPQASHNFGRGLNLADIERIIRKSRELRRTLKTAMSSEDRDQLIREHRQLDPDAFHRAGFDRFNNPLWRYAPGVTRPDVAPTPLLPDHAGDGTPN